MAEEGFIEDEIELVVTGDPVTLTDAQQQQIAGLGAASKSKRVEVSRAEGDAIRVQTDGTEFIYGPDGSELWTGPANDRKA